MKVFQVLADDAALVNGKDHENEMLDDMYMGITYLIVNKEGKYYYDDQIIKIPKDKVLRQVGIYQYTTNSDRQKTVPIIMIMDK